MAAARSYTLQGCPAEEGPLYELMVRSSPDALSWHGPDGTFDYASPAWQEMFGHDSEALREMSLAEVAHPDDVELVMEAQGALRGEGRGFCISYRLRGSDGLYVWVESRGGIPPEEAGENGFLVATRDITARRSLLMALESEASISARERALVEQQANFFEVISHAARTPMTSVLGFTALLRERGEELSSARREELFDRLHASARTLAEIIERVTTMGSLEESGKLLVQPVCILGEVVGRVIGELATPDAPIEVAIEETLSVQADPSDVERAVRLFRNNLVAHTPIGTRAWISAAVEGEMVTLTFADDGPGVPDELKEAVFEPFRSSGSRADYNPGIGLGLSVVRKIATTHGGRAWVTDREGGGAAFHLRLPSAGGRLEDTYRPSGPTT